MFSQCWGCGFCGLICGAAVAILATSSVHSLSCRCLAGVALAATRVCSRPDLAQSLGLATTSNLGANGESPMRHSSTSTAKKLSSSVVFWFKNSSAATCSGRKDSATQITFLAPVPAA